MYEIQFFKKIGGTGRIYVWAVDFEKARLYLEEQGNDITRTERMGIIEGIFRAYFHEPQNRFKKRA